jgi:hypothetical protein
VNDALAILFNGVLPFQGAHGHMVYDGGELRQTNIFTPGLELNSEGQLFELGLRDRSASINSVMEQKDDQHPSRFRYLAEFRGYGQHTDFDRLDLLKVDQRLQW